MMKRWICVLLCLWITFLSAQAQDWPQFGKTAANMAVTDAATPVSASQTAIKWAVRLGQGYQNNPSPPILAEGAMFLLCGQEILKLDPETGETLLSAQTAGISRYSYTPLTYSAGVIYAAMDDGLVQAFAADTLEPLWTYQDPLGGQGLTPVTYADGLLYTGFWNGETREANYICLRADAQAPEQERLVWAYPSAGGFYWAGAYVSGDTVVFGCDDGALESAGIGRVVCLNRLTGEVCSSFETVGDVRSTVSYDGAAGRVYVSSKGGYVYSARLLEDGTLTDILESAPFLGEATGTPAVYNGRLYIGAAGERAFGNEGHTLNVLDAETLEHIYSAPMKGYPQGSALVSTAYEAQTGKVYVYATYNLPPGGITVLEDSAGQTDPVFSELFVPNTAEGMSGSSACSVVCDMNGTLYYKNDSGYLFALSKTAEKQGSILNLEVSNGEIRFVFDGEAPEASEFTATLTADGKTWPLELTDFSFDSETLHGKFAFEKLDPDDYEKPLVLTLSCRGDSQAVEWRLHSSSSGPLLVTFRLIGDTVHDAPDKHARYTTWIPTSTYEMGEGDTVYDLFCRAMQDAGLQYKGAEDGYVDSIRAPSALGGDWLSEFSNGNLSGWMYAVNGEYPSDSIAQYRLQDGDQVVFHYIDDHIGELAALGPRWLDAEDRAPSVSYTEEELPEEGQPGSLPEIEDGKQTEAAPPAGETPVVTAPKVKFSTPAPAHWAAPYVDTLQKKGLIAMEEAAAYAPDAVITRAEFVALLSQICKGAPESSQQIFKDAKQGDWWYASALWAYENQLIYGTDQGLFLPDAPLSRQDVIVILARLAGKTERIFPAKRSMRTFLDADLIADYAVAPLKTFYCAGVLDGDGAGYFHPDAPIDRGQAAKLMVDFFAL